MRKYYFITASILMLILSLVGFSDNLITDTGQESNSDPKFIIHGLFLFAWFIILISQTNFIRKENYEAHIKLGIAGMFVAAGVLITTLYIFVVVYKGWDVMPINAKVNRLFMPSFALWVWLGYMNRKKPVKHKRFMYVGTLYMLGPILDRALDDLFPDELISNTVGWGPFIIGFWSLFFISLIIYDWLTLKKIHPVTYLGFIWFYIVWLITAFI